MEMIDKSMKSTKTSETHPRVSIITVTYNAEPLLERTLQSVLAQRYADKEIVVVDGQSSDGTVAVIKRHAAAIQSWVSEPDKGIYDAMNKGVQMATGDWILFMNAGDTFASDDVLQRLFDAVDPAQADVVYGDVVKGGVVKAASKGRATPVSPYHRMLFCHQSVLTRRSCLLDTPFDIRHRLSADFKFFLLQYQQGARFQYVPLPVSVFDTGGVSNRSRSKGLLDNIRVVCEVIPFPQRLLFVARLAVPYLMCRLRGK